MRTGVPQADLPVIATGQELRPPGVDSQTPQLISVTLERTREFLCFCYNITAFQMYTLFCPAYTDKITIELQQLMINRFASLFTID